MAKRTDLSIGGMHCASCVTILERSLSKVNGVETATVNLATEKATIVSSQAVSTSDLISAVEKKGYTAKAIDENSKGADIFEKKKKEIESLRNLLVFSLFFAIPTFIIGMVFMWLNIEVPYSNWILFALATPVQFISGWSFYRGSWSALKNKSASMDTLIALGTSAAYFFSVYTIFFDPLGTQYFETSAILITFVVLGKYLEENAKAKTSSAIKNLIKLKPKIAIIIDSEGLEKQVSVDDIKEGDTMLVKPGEQVAVDGIIIDGVSAIDESMVTGESIPSEKKAGDKVIGATINRFGSFKFRATKVGENTTLARIIKLIEEAQGKKAPIQKFADEISHYFVPAIILIALLTFSAWYFILNESLKFALTTGVAVLVIACPCALGLATPTAIMVGTGKGAAKGILIKGGDSLESAHKIKYIILDKTGTITTGKPEVTEITSHGYSAENVLRLAASIESESEHPLAQAIAEFGRKKGLELSRASQFSAIPGKGIKAIMQGRTYLAGTRKFMTESSVNVMDYDSDLERLENEGKTGIYLAEEGQVLGLIGLSDVIKETSPAAIDQLKKMGIRVYMVTGDNERAANSIAKKLGIDYFAEILPEQKAGYVKKLQSEKKGLVAMVGDGINDAPALAQADVGIVMGSGTDVAIESGNVVLMHNDLLDVAKAIRLSRMTMSKIRQNMFWALAYNVAAIPIAAGALYYATGWLLSPIIAGAAMAMSSVSVVGNSLLLKIKKI